jgi:hypothetical protein
MIDVSHCLPAIQILFFRNYTLSSEYFMLDIICTSAPILGTFINTIHLKKYK